MAISKTENYLVLNENSSPVAISTKYESFIVPGGTPDAPGSLPLTLDEISVVHSKCNAFRIGLLRFEPEFEADIYKELRITNWQDILSIKDIEKILLDPTAETFQRLLDIESDAEFERVRGVLIGLKSVGADISSKVDSAIELRRKELAKKQRKTSIRLQPAQQVESAPSKEAFDALQAKLEAMEKMVADLMGAKASVTTEPVEKPARKPANKAKKAEKAEE